MITLQIILVCFGFWLLAMGTISVWIWWCTRDVNLVCDGCLNAMTRDELIDGEACPYCKLTVA